MNKKKHSPKSDLSRVDAQPIGDREYDEIPELTEEMIGRAVVKRGGSRIGLLKEKMRAPSLQELNEGDADISRLFHDGN